MYDTELQFLEEHSELLDKNDFGALWKEAGWRQWSNILKIFFDPEININPFEGMTAIPADFLYGLDMPDLDLVIPANITTMESVAFRNCSVRSITFENPDCDVHLTSVTADLIKLPANIKFEVDSKRLYNVDAKVILPKSVDYISRGSIGDACSRLLLVWTADAPVKMDVMYTPKNKNKNIWKATKHNITIKR